MEDKVQNSGLWKQKVNISEKSVTAFHYSIIPVLMSILSRKIKKRHHDENEYFEAGRTVHEHIIISMLSVVGIGSVASRVNN